MISTEDRLWIFNNPDKLFWCKECNGYFREDTNCWCDRVTAYEERINELRVREVESRVGDKGVTIGGATGGGLAGYENTGFDESGNTGFGNRELFTMKVIRILT